MVKHLLPFIFHLSPENYSALSLAVQNNKANFYCTVTLRKEMSGERYLAKFIDATPKNVIDKKYTYS